MERFNDFVTFELTDRDKIEDWLDRMFASRQSVYMGRSWRYQIFVNPHWLEYYGYPREALREKCKLHKVLYNENSVLEKDAFMAFVDIQLLQNEDRKMIDDILRSCYDD